MLQRIAPKWLRNIVVRDSRMIETRDINVFKPSRSWSLEEGRKASRGYFLGNTEWQSNLSQKFFIKVEKPRSNLQQITSRLCVEADQCECAVKRHHGLSISSGVYSLDKMKVKVIDENR
jgi:hypothetical protein